MVSLADAGTHPWAVMVVHFDASAAVTAVERSWWFHNIARAANLKLDLLPLHNRVIV